jgi:hypothetical protein
MEIRLYKNFVKMADETKQPSGGFVSKPNVRLKEETSIMSPTFLLSEYDSSYNYIYVPKWGRYYFVNDTTLNIEGLFEIHCEFDHLASYKPSIGEYICYVERCSNTAQINHDLYDSAISSTEKIIDVKQATTALFGSGGVVVCRTMNDAHGITTYIGSMDNFKDLFNPNVENYSQLADKVDAVLEYYLCNPGDYVLDTYFLALPLGVITASGHTTTDTVCSGWYGSGGAYRWTSNSPFIHDSVILNKPSPRYQDFRESSPAFTQHLIYIPGVGEMPLSGDLIDTTLSLDWCVDINTGEVAYQLKSTDRNGDTSLIATYHGNIKSGLQTGSMMPNGTGVITSAVGSVASAMSGNPVAIGLAMLNVTQNIISPTPSINGSMGSCAGVVTQPNVVITRISKDCADSPITLGKPCGKNLKLSTIPGYIKCAGANIDNIAGTLSDKERINNSLNNGFYYT